MFSTHLLVYLVPLLLPLWHVDAICCKRVLITFNVPRPYCKSCEDVYPAYSNGFDSEHRCRAYLCGNLRVPNPCCGIGKCNYFCCKCQRGCWEPQEYIYEDFMARRFPLAVDL